MNKLFDVAIIGGGAAGMMAAISAAVEGMSVVLIEKNEALGLKVLATGNGRCNITNQNIDIAHYHGSVKKYFNEIYSQFDNKQLKELFGSLGVDLVTEDRGRMFPESNQSKTVVDALERELQRLGVNILLSAEVKSIDLADNWKINFDLLDVIQSKTMIITTGGKAAYSLGSSGDGLFWSMKLGHAPTKIYASLVPLELESVSFVPAMGVKVVASTRVLSRGKVIAENKGDLLFTHFGISGPAAMGLAGYIAPLIEIEKVEISVDLMPEVSDVSLDKYVIELMSTNQKKSIENIISEILPKKLVTCLLKYAVVNGNKNGSEISKSERRSIVESIKSLRLKVKKLRPLKEAQVTAGGIPESQIDSKLASLVVKDLYFAGEILDIDGDSGGYNLQWAWSSGYVVGKNIAKGRK